LDSLIFEYNGVKHSILLSDLDLAIFDNFMPFSILARSDLIEIDDYNFDGYLDISVFDYIGSGVKNMMCQVFLYNPQKKRFFHHEKLSEMSGLFVDKEREIVHSFWAGGMASMIFGAGEYKWENG